MRLSLRRLTEAQVEQCFAILPGCAGLDLDCTPSHCKLGRLTAVLELDTDRLYRIGAVHGDLLYQINAFATQVSDFLPLDYSSWVPAKVLGRQACWTHYAIFKSSALELS
jgi:hypothetical protein